MQYNVVYGDAVVDQSVVSLAMAKKNSNIEYTDDDDFLKLLLNAAVQDAENYIDAAILYKEVKINVSEFSEFFLLPIYPVETISSITYKDAQGVEQTVASADYLFYTQGSQQKIKFLWGTAPQLQDVDFPVTINCMAGYKTADVPPAIVSAILMRFSHKECFREDVPTSCNRSFQSALRPYKWR